MLAGQIGKPHGTAGDVYVVRISDDPHRFEPGARLLHEDGRELLVASSRQHRDRFLVRFEGVASRSEAEALRGALFVPADEVRDLDEGEFWIHELEGFSVVVDDGGEVGTLIRVDPGAAQDLLVIDTPNGERLVPYVAEIVVGVNKETQTITIDPPAGLLD